MATGSYRKKHVLRAEAKIHRVMSRIALSTFKTSHTSVPDGYG